MPLALGGTATNNGAASGFWAVTRKVPAMPTAAEYCRNSRRDKIMRWSLHPEESRFVRTLGSLLQHETDAVVAGIQCTRRNRSHILDAPLAVWLSDLR